MSETFNQGISRRKAFTLFAGVFGAAALPAEFMASDAKAEETTPTAGTPGMQRRQARRTGRHERREARRTGRHERRETRRGGSTETTGQATGQK
jgi:hypothetical protein